MNLLYFIVDLALTEKPFKTDRSGQYFLNYKTSSSAQGEFTANMQRGYLYELEVFEDVYLLINPSYST